MGIFYFILPNKSVLKTGFHFIFIIFSFQIPIMKLHSIETGNFKLDGGAMFGVVPKTLWQRTNPADANNMIEMSMRCLLIEEGDRLILIDTGLGDKQSEKFFSYYYLYGDFSLDQSLAEKGFHRDDITDVVLTHLHFDHVGGAAQWNKDRSGFEPAFKNAKFWTNQNHWKWATEPNAREKASFLSENIMPLYESGQLHFIDIPKQNFGFIEALGFDILFVDGHTEKQMIPFIQYHDKKIVFAADLLPTAGHLPIPYVMGYDTRPLLTLDEKTSFLNQCADENFYLFLEHDAYNEVITVQQTEKGVRLKDTFKLDEII